ncbi:hypothetical protein MRX96_054549 [Rhipicephalus microplus]
MDAERSEVRHRSEITDELALLPEKEIATYSGRACRQLSCSIDAPTAAASVNKHATIVERYGWQPEEHRAIPARRAGGVWCWKGIEKKGENGGQRCQSQLWQLCASAVAPNLRPRMGAAEDNRSAGSGSREPSRPGVFRRPGPSRVRADDERTGGF